MDLVPFNSLSGRRRPLHSPQAVLGLDRARALRQVSARHRSQPLALVQHNKAVHQQQQMPLAHNSGQSRRSNQLDLALVQTRRLQHKQAPALGLGQTHRSNSSRQMHSVSKEALALDLAQSQRHKTPLDNPLDSKAPHRLLAVLARQHRRSKQHNPTHSARKHKSQVDCLAPRQPRQMRSEAQPPASSHPAFSSVRRTLRKQLEMPSSSKARPRPLSPSARRPRRQQRPPLARRRPLVGFPLVDQHRRLKAQQPLDSPQTRFPLVSQRDSAHQRLHRRQPSQAVLAPRQRRVAFSVRPLRRKAPRLASPNRFHSEALDKQRQRLQQRHSGHYRGRLNPLQLRRLVVCLGQPHLRRLARQVKRSQRHLFLLEEHKLRLDKVDLEPQLDKVDSVLPHSHRRQQQQAVSSVRLQRVEQHQQ